MEKQGGIGRRLGEPHSVSWSTEKERGEKSQGERGRGGEWWIEKEEVRRGENEIEAE